MDKRGVLLITVSVYVSPACVFLHGCGNETLCWTVGVRWKVEKGEKGIKIEREREKKQEEEEEEHSNNNNNKRKKERKKERKKRWTR